MYKVLIADDEPKVCRLIEYVVEWDKLGLKLAGIAENGMEALELIKEERIDIVITDIRMPGYDGLELIRRAKEINPKIGFIIISGHRQFDYAQKAIHYGVEDYLLKPIDENELNTILKKMVAEKESDREETEQKFTLERQVEKGDERLRMNFIEAMITNPGKLEAPLNRDRINEEYRCHFKEGLYQVVVIKADIAFQEGNNETYRLLERQVQHLAETELTPGSLELLSWMGAEGVYVLLNMDYEYERELRKRLKRIRANIRTLRDLFWEIQATVGVGCLVETFADIKISVDGARRAILNRLYLGVNHTIGVLDERENGVLIKNLVDSKTRFEFMAGIETLNERVVLNILIDIKNRTQKEKDMDGEQLLWLCEELIDSLVFSLKKMCGDKAVINLKKEFQNAFHMCTTVDDVFLVLKKICTKGLKKATTAKEMSETRPIREVKKYIQEHYNEPIKLEDVSSLGGFNPNYFSGMFKQETGMNFSEYLTRVRIEKAKQFLIEGKKTAMDIALEVGYSDAKYFYKIFKKTTGLTPMEFARLYQKMD